MRISQLPYQLLELEQKERITAQYQILLLVQEQQRVLLTLLQPMIVFMKEMKQLLYLYQLFQVQMLQKAEHNQ